MCNLQVQFPLARSVTGNRFAATHSATFHTADRCVALLKQSNMKIIFLIILGLTSILSSGQSRCDTLRKEVFIATEEPPTPSISYDQLVLILNKAIDLSDYNAPKEKIYINFIINCHGEDFNYKTLKPIDNNLMDDLIKTIKTNLTWSPGKHNKQNVDFSKTLTIIIENGKFKDISDGSKTKIRGKKLLTPHNKRYRS